METSRWSPRQNRSSLSLVQSWCPPSRRLALGEQRPRFEIAGPPHLAAAAVLGSAIGCRFYISRSLIEGTYLLSHLAQVYYHDTWPGNEGGLISRVQRARDIPSVCFCRTLLLVDCVLGGPGLVQEIGQC